MYLSNFQQYYYLLNQQARNNIAGYNTLVSADRGRFELPVQFPVRLSFSQVP